MQIAVHILGYNVGRFIQPVLANVAPHVDKIYVAYPHRPFGYIPKSRETLTNPTRREDVACAELGDKLQIIEGDWLTEEEMRNACFDRAKQDGFDWLLIQDADEFYPEQCWRQLRRALLASVNEEHLITTWYNFWKSSEFVITYPSGDIKRTNAGFALRCKPHLKFTSRRITNAPRSRVIDAPCYHYGYVMTDEEMREKLVTWSHAHEVSSDKWFSWKWLGWQPDSRNLNPRNPPLWTRAIRFPFLQPDFAHQFALGFENPPRRSSADRMAEVGCDARFVVRNFVRKMRMASLASSSKNVGEG